MSNFGLLSSFRLRTGRRNHLHDGVNGSVVRGTPLAETNRWVEQVLDSQNAQRRLKQLEDRLARIERMLGLPDQDAAGSPQRFEEAADAAAQPEDAASEPSLPAEPVSPNPPPRVVESVAAEMQPNRPTDPSRETRAVIGPLSWLITAWALQSANGFWAKLRNIEIGLGLTVVYFAFFHEEASMDSRSLVSLALCLVTLAVARWRQSMGLAVYAPGCRSITSGWIIGPM